VRKQVLVANHGQCTVGHIPFLNPFPILTIGREQEVRRVLAPAPLDLVDLFFNLQTLQVVELGLVRLKLGVELVLASFFL
jgi:hypothetical protein